MAERIVIVGAGWTSDSLVQRLSRVAPIVVIDTSPAALDELTAPTQTAAEDEAEAVLDHSIEKRVADGTSRIVLEDLRGRPSESVALVAATGRIASTSRSAASRRSSSSSRLSPWPSIRKTAATRHRKARAWARKHCKPVPLLERGTKLRMGR